jgi:hypothetical protein
MAEAEGADFGRREGAARQRRRAALLFGHPDFQTLRHHMVNVFSMEYEKTGLAEKLNLNIGHM